MNRLWHRIRYGHRYLPVTFYFLDDMTHGAPVCATCIKLDARRDHEDERRIGGGGF